MNLLKIMIQIPTESDGEAPEISEQTEQSGQGKSFEICKMINYLLVAWTFQYEFINIY